MEITRVQSGNLLDIYCGDQLFQLCIRPTIFMQHNGQAYPINLRAFQEHRLVFRFRTRFRTDWRCAFQNRHVGAQPVEPLAVPPVRATSVPNPVFSCHRHHRRVATMHRNHAHRKVRGECIENPPEVFPFWSNYQIRVGNQVFHMPPVSPREEIPEALDAMWSRTRSVRTDCTKMPSRLFSRLRLVY